MQASKTTARRGSKATRLPKVLGPPIPLECRTPQFEIRPDLDPRFLEDDLIRLGPSLRATSDEGCRASAFISERCSEGAETRGVRRDRVNPASTVAESLQFVFEPPRKSPSQFVNRSDCGRKYHRDSATLRQVGIGYRPNAAIHEWLIVNHHGSEHSRQSAARCNRERKRDARRFIPDL